MGGGGPPAGKNTLHCRCDAVDDVDQVRRLDTGIVISNGVFMGRDLMLRAVFRGGENLSQLTIEICAVRFPWLPVWCQLGLKRRCRGDWCHCRCFCRLYPVNEIKWRCRGDNWDRCCCWCRWLGWSVGHIIKLRRPFRVL
jgi:hypothetical protein